MNKLCDEDEKFKASVFRRAIEMAPLVDKVTLGPNATILDSTETSNQDIENSRNKINIDDPKKPSSCSASKNKSRVTFSIEKIRHETEMQRREEVRKAVEKRKQDMVSFMKKLHEDTVLRGQELDLKHEREMAEENARLKAEDERAVQEYELRKRHEAQLQDQRIQELREKLTRETEEHLRQKEAIGRIQTLRMNFAEKCKEIAQLAKTIKNRSLVAQLVAPYAAKLQELNQQIEALSEAGKTGKLTRDDSANADDIMIQTEEICDLCKVDVNKINEIYDEELKREQEIQAQNQARADLINNTPKPSNTVDPLPSNGANNSHENVQPPSNTTGEINSAEMESRQLYLSAYKCLQQYRAALKPFLDANTSPKFHIECNKTITFLIKNISPTSGEYLRGVINDFRVLFEGRNPSHLTQIPQGLTFYKNLAAERFIDQVEESFLVRNPKWIFGVAAVIVCLWAHYPDFGDIFLAHLRIRCPYIIPVSLPHLPDQSVEEFYKSRGYKYEDGKLEDDKDFIQRMSNITKFYAAIIVTRVKKDMIQSHPHGLRNAWRWLAIILNSEPGKDTAVIYARLIKDMLEIVGNAMWSCYPTQFPKLLEVLAQQYYTLLLRYKSEKNCEIALLKDFLYSSITQSCIPPPEGLLPPNFW